MTAALIEQIRAAGATILAEDGRLRLSAPRPLPGELLEAIKAHKSELLELLKERINGIPLAELRALAGSDWPAVEDNRVLLETFARVVATRRMRESGAVPLHYTAVTVCRRCGPVWIFPGAPNLVDGCPWCFNRAKGLPVPTPAGRPPVAAS